MTEKLICSVFRSSKREGMYLYVIKAEQLTRVPEALMTLFGRPAHAMDLLLTRQKKLAEADIGQVMDELVAKGFYLQMPPANDGNMLVEYRRSLPPC